MIRALARWVLREELQTLHRDVFLAGVTAWYYHGIQRQQRRPLRRSPTATTRGYVPAHPVQPRRRTEEATQPFERTHR